jgi:hypothetical protein
LRSSPPEPERLFLEPRQPAWIPEPPATSVQRHIVNRFLLAKADRPEAFSAWREAFDIGGLNVAAHTRWKAFLKP